jgi:hypothetical protein
MTSMSDNKFALEKLPYWKTSRSGVDSWIEKSATEIERAGGVIRSRGDVMQLGQRAFLIEFSLGIDSFRFVWPVPEHKEQKAAAAQAATALYHTVKAKCVQARFQGARRAFFGELLMDGKALAEVPADQVPRLLMG